MDMSPYRDAMRDVATAVRSEHGEWTWDDGEIADSMHEDGRFGGLDELEFVEVRDAIGELVKTGVVTLSWPTAAPE